MSLSSTRGAVHIIGTLVVLVAIIAALSVLMRSSGSTDLNRRISVLEQRVATLEQKLEPGVKRQH